MTTRRFTQIAVAGGVGLALAVGASFWLHRHRPLNVLLITLDTTRADHLGAYGCDSCETPVLDHLARSGATFDRAYTVAPVTLPSHASILTGLYPAETGLTTNGRGRLSEDCVSITEILQANGYKTGAFVSSFVLDSRFGLDQGFSVYGDDLSGADSEFAGAHRRRPGQNVVDEALAWLSENQGEPFFCWVHLYDPHAPYLDHQDLFGDRFQGRPYDAEIAYTDRQVGRLVEFLKSNGLDDETLVVVTADHGEGLGEHHEETHGSTIYNSILHVPLIISGTARIPAGQRISEAVSVVDMSPTLLDLLELKSDSDVSGRSLAPAFLDQPIPPAICYAATEEPLLRSGWSPLRSGVDGNWKVILTPREELYNLADDPNELRNLAESNSEMLQAMKSRVIEFENSLQQRRAETVELSSRDRKALESLGYVGGTASGHESSKAAIELLDIKDMLPFDNAVAQAVQLKHQGMEEEAIRQLRDIVRQAPSHTRAHLYLADLLSARSEFDEAAEAYQAALAVKPDMPGAHYGLAYLLVARGRRDEAIEEYRKEIEIDPDAVEARCNLAALIAGRGDLESAINLLNSAVSVDPWSSQAFLTRGRLLRQQGRTTDALNDYRHALQLAPDDPALNRELGSLQADLGDFQAATERLTHAARKDPQHAEGQFLLGSLLLHQGQVAAAIQHLRIAVKLQPESTAAVERLREAERRGPSTDQTLQDAPPAAVVNPQP